MGGERRLVRPTTSWSGRKKSQITIQMISTVFFSNLFHCFFFFFFFYRYFICALVGCLCTTVILSDWCLQITVASCCCCCCNYLLASFIALSMALWSVWAGRRALLHFLLKSLRRIAPTDVVSCIAASCCALQLISITYFLIILVIAV